MDLERCFDELVRRLVREDRDLCRVELLAWFDRVVRRYRRRYRLLYRQFRELLPHALGLVRPDGTLVIDCGDRRICNEPALCLRAYLICRKRWMRRELEMLAPGTPYAEVARAVLGEADVHEECGSPPCLRTSAVSHTADKLEKREFRLLIEEKEEKFSQHASAFTALVWQCEVV